MNIEPSASCHYHHILHILQSVLGTTLPRSPPLDLQTLNVHILPC